MKKIFITFMLLLVITGCGYKKVKKETNEVSNKFETEYESLNGEKSKSGKVYPSVDIDDKNLMVYASEKDIENLFENKGSGIIYFGYPECPWCRNAVPNLIKGVKRTTLDKIYYLNIHDMRDTKIVKDGKVVETNKGSDLYYKLLNWMDSVLEEYTIEDEKGNEVDALEKRIYVPLVVAVKEGKIVGYHLDTLESQTDPYVELKESEKRELQSIYENLAHKVLDDLCDENC